MDTIERIGRKCTACRACEQVCPKNAIRMKENYDGFIYPIVDKSKCINCGLCVKKCHVNTNTGNIREKEYIALKPKSKEIAIKSTSGGIAHIISKMTINKKGYVFGAIMDENFNVKHIGENQEKELEKFRGSKYVISDTEDTFSKVKEKLEKNIHVLYIGTACQIAGLKTYLGKEYDKLLTIDIICHGVPSNKLFKKYIEYLEKKYKCKIATYEFRNKDKTSWGMGYTAKIIDDNNKVRYLRADFDPYYINFLKGKTARECCYFCKYTNVDKRAGDITVGDFWGVEKFRPEFYDKYGVSLCVINTEKGKRTIEEMKDIVKLEEVGYKEAVFFNRNLEKPTTRPEERNNIYNGIDEIEASEYIKKRLKVKKSIDMYLKIIAPKKLRRLYKKYLKK